MFWNISIILVWLSVVCTIIITIISCQKKGKEIAKPINIIFCGIIVSGIFGIFPANYIADGLSDNVIVKFIEALSLTLVNVMQMFTVDFGGKDLLDTINAQEAFYFQQPYVFTMSIICTIAPLLTVGVLASVLMSLSARRRYLFSFFKPAYIFSDLNERSITLASDLKKKNPNSVVVFTDVVDREEETFLDLSNRAKSLGSILFKQDILSQKFHWHRKGVEITFFIVSDDETENLNHSLTIIDRYKERENTRLYLFSSTRESELALSKVDRGNVKIHRINEVKSLIYRTLYEKGDMLFSKATTPDHDGVKHINAIVLGMGNYGTEMVKALAWFCQMDGYKLSIQAFDKDPKAESRFKALCPDLLSDKYNGVAKDGESYYSITVHSGMDVDTYELIDFLDTTKGKQPTFIFISLGSDEENIRTATNMRMIMKRLGIEPIIQTVVKNSYVSKTLADVVNYRGEEYHIDYIGDTLLEYSKSVIINSELELKALERHKKWGDEESFWAYEYNYNSSAAPIIHYKARDKCGIAGTDKLNNQGIAALNPDEIRRLRCLEHRRWNAYMRAEGYVYGNLRNDIAKTHPNLISFYDLDTITQEKDEIQ